MTAMNFHRCGEVDSGRTAVRDGFVSYNFETGSVIGLEAETIPANRRVRSSDEAPISFTLPHCWRTSVSVLLGPPLRRCGGTMISTAVCWKVRMMTRFEGC